VWFSAHLKKKKEKEGEEADFQNVLTTAIPWSLRRDFNTTYISTIAYSMWYVYIHNMILFPELADCAD